jgi:hypothetical protein
LRTITPTLVGVVVLWGTILLRSDRSVHYRQNRNNSKNLRLISEPPASQLPPLPADVAQMVKQCQSLSQEIREQILDLLRQAK